MIGRHDINASAGIFQWFPKAIAFEAYLKSGSEQTRELSLCLISRREAENPLCQPGVGRGGAGWGKGFCRDFIDDGGASL